MNENEQRILLARAQRVIARNRLMEALAIDADEFLWRFALNEWIGTNLLVRRLEASNA